MDPVSILSIAGSAASLSKLAWAVGESLYAFFDDVRVVDSTVSGLVSEVKALSNACALVDDRLRDIVRDFDSEVRKSSTNRDKLWTCIRVQIDECQQSITQLRLSFENVKKEGSHALGQMWRQVKLNMQAKDIGEARNRIRSHTASLQTILQTVAIEICYLAPQRADQQLRTLLGGMEECMTQLMALRQERSEQNSSKHTVEEDVLSICEEAMYNGESLYAASMANSSLLGDPAAGAKVRDWMRDISAIDEIVSRPFVAEMDAHSAISTGDVVSTGISDDTTARESSPAAYPTEPADKTLHEGHTPGEPDLDSDDEFLAEMAQEALDVARSSFETKYYKEAKAYLLEALKLVRELPAKRQQNICDTWELRYMLSVCTFHLQEPADAEADLMSVLDNASRTSSANSEHLRQVCEVGHLLSQVCIKLGKLEQARLYCENALQGRRRILGKDHEDYFESVALTARILQLQGNDLRATIYLRKVPHHIKEAFEDTMEQLCLPDESHSSVTSVAKNGRADQQQHINTSPRLPIDSPAEQPEAVFPILPGGGLETTNPPSAVLEVTRRAQDFEAHPVSRHPVVVSKRQRNNPDDSHAAGDIQLPLLEEFAVFHTTFGDIVLGALVKSTRVNKELFSDFLKDVRNGMFNVQLQAWHMNPGEGLYINGTHYYVVDDKMSKDCTFALSDTSLNRVRGKSRKGTDRGWAEVDVVKGYDVIKTLLAHKRTFWHRRINRGVIRFTEVLKSGERTRSIGPEGASLEYSVQR